MYAAGTLKSKKGFTLIEILMVIMLVAILAAVALPQFVDYRNEARNAAVNAALAAVRTGILNASAQMAMRCNSNPGTFPALASLTGNSLITGGNCTALQITAAADAQIVAGVGLPVNPWGGSVAAGGPGAANNVVTASAGAATANIDCVTGVAYVSGGAGGWCYNATTGAFWANSNANPNANEYTF